MDIKSIIVQSYEIGPIGETENPRHGSGNTTLLEAGGKKYVAKCNERPDFIRTYAQAQVYLEQEGLRHPRLVKTRATAWMTPEGVALYEFVEGETVDIFSSSQLTTALKYLRRYNQTLKQVPLAQDDLEFRNHWDQARSLPFLVSELPSFLATADIPDKFKAVINVALASFAPLQQALSANKQLIHADPGPGNFLLSGDEIVAIIDFTPDYNHQFYSLAQFVYWTHLWPGAGINRDALDYYLIQYLGEKVTDSDRLLFFYFLIYAALFRVTGPLLDCLQRDGDVTRLSKRVEVLAQLVGMVNKI